MDTRKQPTVRYRPSTKQRRTSLTVLHVIKRYSGGARGVIANITEELTDFEHHLLYLSCDLPEDFDRFTSVQQIRGGLRVLTDVHRAADRVRPSVIHAHSSHAGVYTRARPLPAPVVYQPHGYAFQDNCQPKLLRTIYRALERSLANRSALTVAVSASERTAAEQLTHNPNQVKLIANAPRVSPLNGVRNTPAHGEIVMSGRICPQKSPALFAQVAARSRQLGLADKYVWIGDGDPSLRALLEGAGVEVTGWLSVQRVQQRLDGAFAYVHSSESEAFPLTVLEAAARQVPIIVRKIPAFTDTQLHTFITPDDLIASLQALHASSIYRDDIVARGATLLVSGNLATMGQALRELYEDVATDWRHQPAASALSSRMGQWVLVIVMVALARMDTSDIVCHSARYPRH